MVGLVREGEARDDIVVVVDDQKAALVPVAVEEWRLGAVVASDLDGLGGSAGSLRPAAWPSSRCRGSVLGAG